MSYINRSFATLTDQSISGDIDSLDEGKGERWHVTVKTPDGRYQRYYISKATADTLKSAKQVRMSIARGALGFEFMTKFEPAGS